MDRIKAVTIEVRKEEARHLVLYLIKNIIGSANLTEGESEYFKQLNTYINTCIGDAEILNMLANYEGKDILR